MFSKLYALSLSLSLLTTPVAAGLCTAIREATRLSDEWASSPDAPAPTLVLDLVLNAALLRTFYPPSAPFRAAISAYVDNVEARLDPASKVNSVLALRQSNRILTQLQTVSGPFCQPADDITTESANNGTTVAPSQDNSMGPLWGWLSPNLFVSALFVLLGGFVVVTYRRLKTQERRRKRYLCDIPVTLVMGARTYQNRMLDINAYGAKINLTGSEGGEINVILQLPRTQVPATITWRNAHFAGLQFERRLPVATILKLVATSRRGRLSRQD